MSMKKIKWNKLDLIHLVIILIPMILTISFYQSLPEQLAVHFGLNGEPDGFQSKTTFLLLYFVLLIGIFLFMKIVPTIDPKKRNYEKFKHTYDYLRMIITIFLSGIFITVLLYNIGYSVNIQMIVLIGIGILFMFIGNDMARIRFNYTIGIRTPWTLSNEEIWRRTHRFSGPLWFAGGFIILFLAFVRGTLAFILMMITVIILTTIPLLYSYLLYRKLEEQK